MEPATQKGMESTIVWKEGRGCESEKGRTVGWDE